MKKTNKKMTGRELLKVIGDMKPEQREALKEAGDNFIFEKNKDRALNERSVFAKNLGLIPVVWFDLSIRQKLLVARNKNLFYVLVNKERDKDFKTILSYVKNNRTGDLR